MLARFPRQMAADATDRHQGFTCAYYCPWVARSADMGRLRPVPAQTGCWGRKLAAVPSQRIVN